MDEMELQKVEELTLQKARPNWNKYTPKKRIESIDDFEEACKEAFYDAIKDLVSQAVSQFFSFVETFLLRQAAQQRMSEAQIETTVTTYAYPFLALMDAIGDQNTRHRLRQALSSSSPESQIAQLPHGTLPSEKNIIDIRIRELRRKALERSLGVEEITAALNNIQIKIVSKEGTSRMISYKDKLTKDVHNFIRLFSPTWQVDVRQMTAGEIDRSWRTAKTTAMRVFEEAIVAAAKAWLEKQVAEAPKEFDFRKTLEEELRQRQFPVETAPSILHGLIRTIAGCVVPAIQREIHRKLEEDKVWEFGRFVEAKALEVGRKPYFHREEIGIFFKDNTPEFVLEEVRALLTNVAITQYFINSIFETSGFKEAILPCFDVLLDALTLYGGAIGPSTALVKNISKELEVTLISLLNPPSGAAADTWNREVGWMVGELLASTTPSNSLLLETGGVGAPLATGYLSSFMGNFVNRVLSESLREEYFNTEALIRTSEINEFLLSRNVVRNLNHLLDIAKKTALLLTDFATKLKDDIDFVLREMSDVLELLPDEIKEHLIKLDVNPAEKRRTIYNLTLSILWSEKLPPMIHKLAGIPPTQTSPHFIRKGLEEMIEKLNAARTYLSKAEELLSQQNLDEESKRTGCIHLYTAVSIITGEPNITKAYVDLMELYGWCLTNYLPHYSLREVSAQIRVELFSPMKTILDSICGAPTTHALLLKSGGRRGTFANPHVLLAFTAKPEDLTLEQTVLMLGELDSMLQTGVVYRGKGRGEKIPAIASKHPPQQPLISLEGKEGDREAEGEESEKEELNQNNILFLSDANVVRIREKADSLINRVITFLQQIPQEALRFVTWRDLIESEAELPEDTPQETPKTASAQASAAMEIVSQIEDLIETMKSAWMKVIHLDAPRGRRYWERFVDQAARITAIKNYYRAVIGEVTVVSLEQPVDTGSGDESITIKDTIGAPEMEIGERELLENMWNRAVMEILSNISRENITRFTQQAGPQKTRQQQPTLQDLENLRRWVEESPSFQAFVTYVVNDNEIGSEAWRKVGEAMTLDYEGAGKYLEAEISRIIVSKISKHSPSASQITSSFRTPLPSEEIQPALPTPEEPTDEEEPSEETPPEEPLPEEPAETENPPLSPEEDDDSKRLLKTRLEMKKLVDSLSLLTKN